MIIVTAGHIDHGKTALLHALTGTNADRLPEEKQRGMTIDLGYAFLALDKTITIGFIDVPGHEKFLANMLAGLGGINHALLVVACDDGVMPQTKEHLLLLHLLAIPMLTIALTKIDRVNRERIDEVKETINAELQKYHWRQVPIFMTSVLSGIGITALQQHFINAYQASAKVKHRFRLAIDRAFSIKGSGLIVTGTALQGEVKVGDKLWLTGYDNPVNIRGLHVQNQVAITGYAGQRIALNLSGSLPKKKPVRGDWLFNEAPLSPFDKVLVVLQSCQVIKHWQPVHLYHGANHTTGRIALLQLNQDNASLSQILIAELHIDTPLYLAENDRLILRDISAQKTIAGAQVIDLWPLKRGKRQAAYLQRLQQRALFINDDVENFQQKLQDQPLNLRQFGWARQLVNRQVYSFAKQYAAQIINDFALSKQQIAFYQQQLLQTLADYHQHHSDQLGLGRARLKRMALAKLADALVFTLIDQLIIEKKVINSRGFLHLPDYQLTFNAQQHSIWQQIVSSLADESYWVRDLAKQHQMDEAQVRQTLRTANKLGYVTAIVPDRYLLTSRIRQFAQFIQQYQQQQGVMNVTIFRDHFMIGRKLAIQILEFFDRSGFTKRRGNDHLLRDEELFLS